MRNAHPRGEFIDESDQKALNTFQWAHSVLLAKCPAAAEDVHRLEADSKKFGMDYDSGRQ